MRRSVATVGELHDAACGKDRWNRIMNGPERFALSHLNNIVSEDRHHYRRTNLRLTGALTADDVRRIGEAK